MPLSFSVSGWWGRLEKLLADLYHLYEREPERVVAPLPDKLCLATRQVIRLRKTAGVRGIHVRQGAVWLTRTPGDGDIILQAGDQLELEHGWPVVVQALQESRVDLWR